MSAPDAGDARPRLFGTDGIRGRFGEPPLDAATVRALGEALGRELRARRGAGARVVLGGDTRASTPTLCRWLARGLTAHGLELRYFGVAPTPAVAWYTRRLDAACGVAVSASHNPYPDNGIKLIDGDGFKWRPEDEAALETLLPALRDGRGDDDDPAGGPLPEPESLDAYLDALAAVAGGIGDADDDDRERPLAGLRIVIDAANGAAAPYAGPLFARLGAEVAVVCAEPNGENINRGCGSTHPESLAARVRAGRHDLGVAFDGDADRAILADEKGAIHDGDAILYLWARDLAARGRLPGSKIVATTMSNLGLERALARHGIGLVRCDVGDREVVTTLQREGLRLGGEQSGHVVDLRLSTTGDGLLTALVMARLVAAAGRPLSRLLDGLARYPQLIENVPVRAKPDLDGLPAVRAARARVEGALGDDGRLVLRYSGTEPLARIMLEGRDRGEIEALAAELAAAIAAEVGAG